MSEEVHPWPALHPRLDTLLRGQGWHELTAPQEQALQPLLDGKHALVVAPTGHGKTEAALLPVMSRMLFERDRLKKEKKAWPKGFKALYVTPLRALNRDLLSRLKSWGEALSFGIGVRHGDTSPGERAKQSRDPPDLLITTPETLQLLLYGDTLRSHLGTVRFVVLDEIHDLLQSERGSQLLVALERLEEVIGQPPAMRALKAAERDGPTETHARPGGGFQRIALSATVADPRFVAHRVAGRDAAGPRPIEAIVVEAPKVLHLTVEVTEPEEADHGLAAELSLAPASVAQLRAVRRIIGEHGRVLIFHNTRDGAELLASRSSILDGREKREGQTLGLHHGSLSAEHRADVEDDFRSGKLRALVATSSLELGIDIGEIDHVVQVQSPRSVARLVQRMGRSGHRAELASDGTLLSAGPEDTLECMAVAHRAKEARLEPLRVRADPLVVLANQIVALTNEYAGLDRGWTRAVVKRSGPFMDVDDDLFDSVWDVLLRLRTLYPHDPDPLKIGRSGRGRRHFLDHVSLIPDERAYRILDESTKRSIGTVDDAFVAAALHPGALFTMAGRNWQVLEVQVQEQRVRVAPVMDLGAIPQWSGQNLPVSYEVAQEVVRLRRAIDEGDKVFLAKVPHSKDALAAASQPIAQQKRHNLVVPTDKVVTLEVGKRVVVANVALGTRGNEALGRLTQALLSQRLGAPVAVDSDAYRIHMTMPVHIPAVQLADLWRELDPRAVDLLLSLALRDSPTLKHHLVHVAKHFGALPKELDPNLMTRNKLSDLMAENALQEEATSRLMWDRLDLDAVSRFITELKDGKVTVQVQAMGPMSLLGAEETRKLMAPPRTNEALVAAVRDRLESADALMACCNCGHHWPLTVRLIPKKPKCRKCGSNQVACLRPWNEDRIHLLTKSVKTLTPEERQEVERMVKNGQIVASFGQLACLALVARGVGPDTAARILQKVRDPANPNFWREILQAELTFARTSAFWKR